MVGNLAPTAIAMEVCASARKYLAAFAQAHVVRGRPRQAQSLIRLTLGFQFMKKARATIKGFEVMRMFEKGRFRF